MSEGNPQWLALARSEAFELFESLDMPSSTEEVWRYVDLEFSLEDFQLATSAGSVLPPEHEDRVVPGLEIVDGLTTGPATTQPSGVSLLPLSEALRDDSSLEARYDGIGVVAHDKFSAASRAFGSDGAHVRISKGTLVPDPVFLEIHAATDQAISFPRVVIEVEEGAEASVVVEFRSKDSITALVVPEFDVTVGDNANFRLTIVQRWGSATTALARIRVVAARDAQITLAEAGLGGTLARLHLAVDLEGRGSSASIIGAFFGDRSQVLDYRYFMRHIGENTTSDMFLKGAVEDEALSIFTGLIRLEESAQGTNAFQTNRNLLLSEDAAAQSVPNLEILANDVKCGHASTVGPLDEEQRYYLMSRGLDQKRADRLQVRGFFEDVLSRFPEQSVAGPVRDRINAKYVDAQEEGRV